MCCFEGRRIVKLVVERAEGKGGRVTACRDEEWEWEWEWGGKR